LVLWEHHDRLPPERTPEFAPLPARVPNVCADIQIGILRAMRRHLLLDGERKGTPAITHLTAFLAFARASLLLAFTVSIVVRAPPSHAGAPFVTDDPQPTELGHFEIDLSAQYAKRQGERSGAVPSLEVDYAALPNLELQVIAAFGFDRDTGSNTKFGVGDTEFGAKYRFIEEDKEGWRPAVAASPQIFVPTGNESRGLGTGHTHYFLPIWLGKEFGEWTTFGGGGYLVGPGTGNKNAWFLGSGATRKITEDLTVGGELFHLTASQAGRKSTTVINFAGISGTSATSSRIRSSNLTAPTAPTLND
jgi:hypothetical protein